MKKAAGSPRTPAVPSHPVVAPMEENGYQPQWSTWTRQAMLVALVIAAVYGLTLLAPVMQLLTLTFLLSLVMFAPTRFFARYLPVPYSVAVALAYALIILVAVIAIVLFIPPATDNVRNLRDDGLRRYGQLQDTLRQTTPEQEVVEVLGMKVDLRPLIDPVRSLILGGETSPSQESAPISTSDIQQVFATLTATLTPAVSGITSFVSTALMALFISFLVLLDLPNLEKALPGWIPPDYHRELTILLHQIGNVWNGFFRGQLLIAIVLGILTWLQLTLMGIHNALVVAVFCGLISLIPTIGGIISLIPIALISFLQGSSVLPDLSNGTLMLLVVLINLVISQVIWNVVAPKILGDAVNLPLPIIIVGIFIGAALGGILGAFLITPIIGTIRVIVVYILRKVGRLDPFPGQEVPQPPVTMLHRTVQAGQSAAARVVQRRKSGARRSL